jgi:hypothetical protein
MHFKRGCGKNLTKKLGLSCAKLKLGFIFHVFKIERHSPFSNWNNNKKQNKKPHGLKTL